MLAPRDEDTELTPVANIGNYHIVNQIIARGLHNSSDEVKLYTADLMDKLEQVRRTAALPASHQWFLRADSGY